jgi:hypothetical protein
MNQSGQPEASGRLQRALTGFQRAQGILLTTHRRLKNLPAEEVERFWVVQGDQIERHLQAAAVEVVAASKAFSAAGLVADAGDQHLITEARRHINEGG